MIDNANFHFRYGQCHAMAIALHRRTGLPLGIIVGMHGSRDNPEIEFCRPVVMVGDSGYIDVDGHHDRLDVGMLGFANQVFDVRIVPSGIAEVAKFFGEAGVDPVMVRQAEAFIDEDPALTEYFAAHRSVDMRI